MNLIKLSTLSILLSLSSVCTASDPDFHMSFDNCQMTVGYLVLSDDSLQVMDGDPSYLSCIRKGDAVDCNINFTKTGARVIQSYSVVIDSPPALHFRTNNGSDYIAVDTVQMAATQITRLSDTKLAGSKVCQGVFATGQQLKMTQSK